jgi:hypothetical protein
MQGSCYMNHNKNKPKFSDTFPFFLKKERKVIHLPDFDVQRGSEIFRSHS